jgi:hypothetical protein
MIIEVSNLYLRDPASTNLALNLLPKSLRVVSKVSAAFVHPGSLLYKAAYGNNNRRL